MTDIEKFSGYDEFLKGLKERIKSAQRATLSVNLELLRLYWQIGRDIRERQTRDSWGSGVIERISRDLKNAIPGQEGFSPRSLRSMRQFAELWQDEGVVENLRPTAARCPGRRFTMKLYSSRASQSGSCG